MDSTTENGNLATDFELSEGIDDGNELLHFKSSMRSSDGIMKFQPIWRRIRRGQAEMEENEGVRVDDGIYVILIVVMIIMT